jgi:hypothetical protein
MKNIQSKLKMVVIAGIALTAITITSCSKKSSSPGITPIGGYDSSGAVASANLIAYFPFDGNSNDVKGGLTATTVGVTYNAGIKGQAYQGDTTSYATLPVPPSTPFNSLSSYSFSVWYKEPAQSTKTQGLFFLGNATVQDELIYEIEPYNPVSGDSVKIHHGFNDLASPGAYQLFVMESFDTAAINTWIHWVTTYDASTSTFVVYENGSAIGNSSAFSPAPPANPYVTPTVLYSDGTKATALGALGFTGQDPNVIYIGTWPPGLFGVSPTLGSAGGFTGQIDELRIYNKALSQSEVAGLYLNGKAGR